MENNSKEELVDKMKELSFDGGKPLDELLVSRKNSTCDNSEVTGDESKCVHGFEESKELVGNEDEEEVFEVYPPNELVEEGTLTGDVAIDIDFDKNKQEIEEQDANFKIGTVKDGEVKMCIIPETQQKLAMQKWRKIGTSRVKAFNWYKRFTPFLEPQINGILDILEQEYYEKQKTEFKSAQDVVQKIEKAK